MSVTLCRVMQIDTSGPALVQLEASTAASLAVCVAHLLHSLPDNQGSAQWSKAIAAYSPSDTFICGSAALQLLSDAANAQPSATVSWSNDRRVARFQEVTSMVSLPDLEVRPHHSALL